MKPELRILFLSLLLLPVLAVAEITVEVGPTPIPRGDAQGERDITVSNGLFAVAFAVDTAPPWGVARGGIVDIAIVNDGEVGYDIASLADFMPNHWAAWPTSYLDVSIAKSTADEVIIKTVRDWGEVDLETTFHIKSADTKIRVVTTMTNAGEVAIEDLTTGYVSWSDGE